MQSTDLQELGVHTLRVTGISSNAENDTFLSVSDDGTFKVTENTSGSVVAECKPSQGALKQMLTFEHRNCLAVSDAKGNLHLYNKGSEQEKVVTIQVESASEIKGLAISAAENFAVAGCVDGTITVFDLMAAGKERLIKPILTLQGKKNVRCL